MDKSLVNKLKNLEFQQIYKKDQYQLFFIPKDLINELSESYKKVIFEDYEKLPQIIGISNKTFDLLLNLLLNLNRHCIILVNNDNKDIIGHFAFDIVKVGNTRFLYVSGLFVKEKYQKQGLSRILYDQSILSIFSIFSLPTSCAFVLYPMNDKSVMFWTKVHGFEWLTNSKVYLYKRNNCQQKVIDCMKREEDERLQNGDF
jgi:hypothetical protein